MKNSVEDVMHRRWIRCGFLCVFFCISVSTIRARQAVYPDGYLIRPPADTVGYATTVDQFEHVIRLSDSLETDFDFFTSGNKPWIAGIAAHDDHIYSSRVNIHLMRDVMARRIVLFGVAHKARKWDLSDRLIFDAFDAWQSPYGLAPVSTVRETLIRTLEPDSYIVCNECHSEEHSLEGLVPFLQCGNRAVEIIPILIPYMGWDRMDALASKLSDALEEIIRMEKWVLGEDIAFLISNDCIHYGDEGWGGSNYADFGVDEKGYQKAVKRELELIGTHLAGETDPGRLKSLFYRLVKEEDVTQYQITWCGRFSVPFGLNCMHHLMTRLGHPPLKGQVLKYGTTYGLGTLPVGGTGPGVTGPSHLRHWVGFCAIGYR